MHQAKNIGLEITGFPEIARTKRVSLLPAQYTTFTMSWATNLFELLVNPEAKLGAQTDLHDAPSEDGSSMLVSRLQGWLPATT